MGSKKRTDLRREKHKRAQAAKQKRRKLEKEERRIRYKREAARRYAERRTQMFVSGAIGTPAVFRAFVFDHLPDLSGQFTLAGLDFHLDWYATPEDRRRGTGAETVAALEIKTCTETAFDPEAGDYAWSSAGLEAKRYRCEAVLSEHIAAGSTYGAWLRLQEHQGSEPLGDEEFSAASIEFTIVAAVPNRLLRKFHDEHLRDVIPVSLVPSALNIVESGLSAECAERLSDLQIDRLMELFMILRVYAPRLLRAPRRGAQERRMLEFRLEQLEAEEQETVERLRPLAQASRDAKTALDEARRSSEEIKSKNAQALKEMDEALRGATGALKHAEAELKRLAGAARSTQNEVLQAARTIPPDTARLEQLKRRAEQFRAQVEAAPAAVRNAARKQRELESQKKSLLRECTWTQHQAESRIGPAEEALARALAAEQTATKDYDRIFFLREEVLADLHFGTAEFEDLLP